MTFTGPKTRPAITRAIALLVVTLFVTGLALVGSGAIASAAAPAGGDQQVIEVAAPIRSAALSIK